jgi:hypothetical protein
LPQEGRAIFLKKYLTHVLSQALPERAGSSNDNDADNYQREKARRPHRSG